MDFLGLVEDLQEVRVWYECGAGSGGRAWRPSFPSSHFTATVLSSHFTATEAQLKRSVLSCRHAHWGEMSQMEGLCVCFVKKLKIQKVKLNKQIGHINFRHARIPGFEDTWLIQIRQLVDSCG